MKCNHSRPGFELVSPCPFPTTITTTPRAPPKIPSIVSLLSAKICILTESTISGELVWLVFILNTISNFFKQHSQFMNIFNSNMLLRTHLIFFNKFHVVFTWLNCAIGIMVWVFANGPGDRDSFPGWVKPMTQKWYLMPSCLTLNIIRYGSRVKWRNPGKRVVPSPTPRWGSYWKGSFGSSSTTFVNFTYTWWQTTVHSDLPPFWIAAK